MGCVLDVNDGCVGVVVDVDVAGGVLFPPVCGVLGDDVARGGNAAARGNGDTSTGVGVRLRV